MRKTAKIRLFVDAPLGEGQGVPLSQEQAHYLTSVMRQGQGGRVTLFNGRDGEWQAEIVEAAKRKALLRCETRTRAQTTGPDLWLLFAPVRRTKVEIIVEKAVELGVSAIQPVITDYTNMDKLRMDRLAAIAVEAAEQSRRLDVPEVRPTVKLAQLLPDWPHDRQLLYANERAAGDAVWPQSARLPAALLVGPEGGFSDAELARLSEMDTASALSLGPRILRAETAVIAGLSLVQARIGDWRLGDWQ